MSKTWPKGGTAGILHHFTETLVAFEFGSSQSKKDSLIFIGGLSDGLATVEYVADLVKTLEKTSWSVFQPILSTSYQGWGVGSLDGDVDELATCISYINNLRQGRVVIMGHSTGSQDVLHYLSKDVKATPRPVVDGAILQAPVSDRQALLNTLDVGFADKSPAELRAALTQLESLARSAAKQGKADEVIMPVSLTSHYYQTTPINARRWLSLASPSSPAAPEQDDMFSSDLPDEHLAKTFGAIRKQQVLKDKMMVLISGSDGAMPVTIDKDALLTRWKAATDGDQSTMWHVDSGVILGASHALSNEDQAEPRKDLMGRVGRFLSSLAA